MPSALSARESRRSTTSQPMQPAPDQATRSVRLDAAERIFGVRVPAARERFARLTRREREVACLMAGGKPNRAIAEEMQISEKTVDIHRAHVKAKLEAQTSATIANIVSLVRLAESNSGEGF